MKKKFNLREKKNIPKEVLQQAEPLEESESYLFKKVDESQKKRVIAKLEQVENGEKTRAKPGPNRGQTSNKPTSQPLTNLPQTSNKPTSQPLTNLPQTSNKPTSNLPQTSNKPTSQPLTKPLTNLLQTSNKPTSQPLTKRPVPSLSGLQEKILKFIYNLCKMRGDRCSGPIAGPYLANVTETLEYQFHARMRDLIRTLTKKEI